MTLETQLADLRKQNLLRYRQLIAAATLTDAEASELAGLLKALGKRENDAVQDSQTLATARHLRDLLDAGRDLRDADRKASQKLGDARERHKEMIAKANEYLREHVVAENAAHAAALQYSETASSLERLKKQNPHLFAD